MLVSQQPELVPLTGENGVQLLDEAGNPRFRETPHPRVAISEREAKSPSLRRVESSSRIRPARRREKLPRDIRDKADSARTSLYEANPNGGIPTPEILHAKAANPDLPDAQKTSFTTNYSFFRRKRIDLANFPMVACGAELFAWPNTG